MDETYVVDQLVAAAKRHKNTEVFKHADRIRRGVPDVSIVAENGTWWLEAKLIKLDRDDPLAVWRKSFLNKLDLYQLTTTINLDRIQDRARYVIAISVAGKIARLLLLRPAELLRAVNECRDQGSVSFKADLKIFSARVGLSPFERLISALIEEEF